MAHSNRNTSLPHFTSHERTLLRGPWGTKTSRISRDSFLPFDSCRLCLQPARTPVVACATNGDLFCRECAISDLLAQRQEIRRLEREREEARRRIGEEKERSLEEVRRREVREFELVSMGLEGGGGGEKRKIEEEGGGIESEENNGKKRRVSSSLDERKGAVTSDDKERIRLALKKERSESSKPDLNSFWIPSLTPGTDPIEAIANRSVKLAPICPASSEINRHSYSLKSLVDVHFTEENAADDSVSRVCPSCKKNLSNGLNAVLTKPCGHVICSPCVLKFMTPTPDQAKPDPHAPKQEQEHSAAMQGRMLCYVCETDVTPNGDVVNGADGDADDTGNGDKRASKSKKKRKDKDATSGIGRGLVEVSSEGTGFAGKGGNVASKVGIAFQC